MRLTVPRQPAVVVWGYYGPEYGPGTILDAPAGMEYADGVASCVDDDDRQAVGSLDCEQQAGDCGDHAIAGQRFFVC